MTHDPELSCDGLKLWPGGVFNFYCELFHISFIVIAGTTSIMNSQQPAIKSIVRGQGCTCNGLANFMSGKPLNELRAYPTSS